MCLVKSFGENTKLKSQTRKAQNVIVYTCNLCVCTHTGLEEIT